MSKEERSVELADTDNQDDVGTYQGDVFETPGEPPSADDALRAEIDALQQEVDRVKELYLRKLADFDNYRKRQEREMAEYRRLANATLIRDLLQVVDNLERAVVAPASGEGSLRVGVELVLKQLKDTLSKHGVIEVNPDGEPFDPTVHEAIQRVDREDVDENTVIQVMQKGYLLGERLLRPALVVVAVPVPALQIPDRFEEDHGEDHRN
ncbi:MAG: nucleotide exchange factor GrpE [Acidobacteriota bacterium]|nr:nucleotide exchange factor GrpE [Acidobacteriota bacterium]NLH12079.1 nucleotide exchange factor GrpE [Holophagae bacterium]